MVDSGDQRNLCQAGTRRRLGSLIRDPGLWVVCFGQIVLRGMAAIVADLADMQAGNSVHTRNGHVFCRVL